METQEQEHSVKNVKETTSLNFSNNEENVIRTRVEGTPFTKKWEKGKGWQIGIAEYAITEYKNTEEEVNELIEKGGINWDMLISIIGAMIEIQSKFKNK